MKIRTKPTITIHNYDADGLLGLDRPTGGTVELYIGNGKYFSLILDDVMEVQSDLNILSMWSDDAAQQLKIVSRPATCSRASSARWPPPTRASPPASSRARSTWVSRARRWPLSAATRRGSGRTARRAHAYGSGPGRAEHSGSRPLGRHAGVGWPPDQAVGTPSGIPVWRQRLDAAQRPPWHGGSVHDLHVSNLLPNNSSDSAQFNAGEWPIFAGHAHGLTFAIADQQGGDAAVRVDLRSNPARPAGLRLSSRGRPGPRSGSGHAGLLSPAATRD